MWFWKTAIISDYVICERSFTFSNSPCSDLLQNGNDTCLNNLRA